MKKTLALLLAVMMALTAMVIPALAEVSIGHALICDALYLGLETTVRAYLNELADN